MRKKDMNGTALRKLGSEEEIFVSIQQGGRKNAPSLQEGEEPKITRIFLWVKKKGGAAETK